jgi:hypothetical protein
MYGNIAILIPVVAIAASAWVIVKVVQLLRTGRSGGGEAPNLGDVAENVRLTRENEELRHVIGRLEQRLQVLERIATDPAERTAREIEKLR